MRKFPQGRLRFCATRCRGAVAAAAGHRDRCQTDRPPPPTAKEGLSEAQRDWTRECRWSWLWYRYANKMVWCQRPLSGKMRRGALRANRGPGDLKDPRRDLHIA